MRDRNEDEDTDIFFLGDGHFYVVVAALVRRLPLPRAAIAEVAFPD